MVHESESPLAESTVRLSYAATSAHRDTFEEDVSLAGKQFTVVDWWDRVRYSWQIGSDNLSHSYAIRQAHSSIPFDDEVLYGYVDGTEVLVHVTEIEDI